MYDYMSSVDCEQLEATALYQWVNITRQVVRIDRPGDVPFLATEAQAEAFIRHNYLDILTCAGLLRLHMMPYLGTDRLYASMVWAVIFEVRNYANTFYPIYDERESL